MRRLTVFGDSLPKGIVFEDGRLQIANPCAVDILGSKLGFEKVDNLSAYGQTLSRMIRKGITDKYIEQMNKDDDNYVVFCIGGNDADYEWREVAKQPKGKHEPKTPLKVFASLLEAQAEKVVSTGAKVFFVTLPPVNAAKYMNNVIGKIADRDMVMQFLRGDETNIYRNQEAYSDAISRIGGKWGQVVDLRSVLLGRVDCFELYCEDGVHFSRAGQIEAANIILEEGLWKS